MLQTFRERLTGPIIWVVIGLISIPFAFFGIESFRDGGGDTIAAKVGDTKITQAQLNNSYQQAYGQLLQSGQPMIAPDVLRKEVLDDMVENAALAQYVRSAGFRTSDAALMTQIQQIPDFQKDGNFSPTVYKEALAQQGRTPAQVEALLRERLANEQLRTAVLASSFMPPLQSAAGAHVELQQRNFSYVSIPAARYTDTMQVSEDQIHARYDEHKDQYLAPERVKLDYLELALDKLAPAAPPSQDVLKVIYDAEKASRFSTADERHARHILIKFGADKEASRKKAQALAEQLRQGGDFAALAKANSEDIASKNVGGDLGWVHRGSMVPAFEEALFGLKVGDISDPVETVYGWHVMQVEEEHPAAIQAFESPDVQRQLLDIYRQQDAAHRFQDAAKKLDDLAFENSSSLEPSAKALGLVVQTSDWISRATPTGIAMTPAVAQAAFSDEVIKNGDNSKLIQITPTDLIVVHKSAYEAPRQQTFDEVHDSLRESLKAEAAKAKVQQMAASLVTAVQSGQTLDIAAKGAGLDVKLVSDATRTQQSLEPELRDAAFKLPSVSGANASVSQVTLPSDAVAVLSLQSIHDPVDAANEAQSKRFAMIQQNSLAGAEFAAFRIALQQQIGVKYSTSSGTEIRPADASGSLQP